MNILAQAEQVTKEPGTIPAMFSVIIALFLIGCFVFLLWKLAELCWFILCYPATYRKRMQREEEWANRKYRHDREDA